MKSFLSIIGLITVFVVAAFLLSFETPPPSGTFTNLYIQGVTPDTLTNTEADTIEFDKNFDYASTLAVTINNTELSGTATSVWTVEQSAYPSGTTNWVMTDTVGVVTATGASKLTLTARPQRDADNELWGYRVRLIGTNSGTGAHRYNINMLGRGLPR